MTWSQQSNQFQRVYIYFKVNNEEDTMKTPILSVVIPTYNRLAYLKQTLDVLLPQVTDEVEVIISDNCSPDATWEYLEMLEGKVQRFRQETNVGADKNIVSCLSRGQGKYVWLLCDDDLPCSNAIESLLKAIREFDHPPILILKSQWYDFKHTPYDSAPVHTEWHSFGRDQYLEHISYFFAVCSGIVVCRDRVDNDFIQKWIGTFHTPAAIVLSTVGKSNQAVVSDRPLMICRGGGSGGYDALTVFSKNMLDLFKACAGMGYSRRVMERVYDEELRDHMPCLIRNWPITMRGLSNLIISSYRFKSFYTAVIPVLLKVIFMKIYFILRLYPINQLRKLKKKRKIL